MFRATVQPKREIIGKSTILKLCIIRLYFPKTRHKTTGFVTFWGIYPKICHNLSHCDKDCDKDCDKNAPNRPKLKQ